MAKIYLNNVSISFPVYHVNTRSFKTNFLRVATGGMVDKSRHMIINALKDITFTLKNGDRIGLIGHNGAGKSTLLRLLARIYEPTSGKISISGQVSPMLNLMQGIEGEFTGYENIIMRGTVLGLSRTEIHDNIQAIKEFSGLGDYLSMPLRTYSSGMMVRLAFAISTCIKPEILLIDEVFGAGDANFMTKAREKMISLLDQSSIVILASHNENLVKEFCQKILLLDAGKIIFFGNTDEAISIYQSMRKQPIKKRIF